MRRAWRWRNGVPEELSRAWILSYLKRHPTLTLTGVAARIVNIHMVPGGARATT
jgi:hypothetical protein